VKARAVPVFVRTFVAFRWKDTTREAIGIVPFRAKALIACLQGAG
jgi:hypothetical protein